MAPADQLVPKGLEFESMHWASTVTKKPPVVTKMQGPNDNSSGHNNKSFDERLQFSPGKLFLSLDADPIEAANFQSSFAALVSAMYRAAAFCDELSAMFPPDVKLSDDGLFLVERIVSYSSSVTQTACSFVKTHLIGDGTVGSLFTLSPEDASLISAERKKKGSKKPSGNVEEVEVLEQALRAARELVLNVTARQCPRAVVSIDQLCRSLTQQKEAQNNETKRLESIYLALCEKAAHLEERIVREEMGQRASEYLTRGIQLIIPAIVVDTKDFVDAAWEVVFPSTLQNPRGQSRLSEGTIQFKKFFAQRMIEIIDAITATFPRLADVKMLVDPRNVAFHDAMRCNKLSTAQKVVLRYFSVALGTPSTAADTANNGSSNSSKGKPAAAAAGGGQQQDTSSSSSAATLPILQALERVSISSLFGTGSEFPTSLSFMQGIQRVREALRVALTRVRWSGSNPTSETTIANIVKLAVTGEAARLRPAAAAAAEVSTNVATTS